MATADPSPLLTVLPLLDSMSMETQVESGAHTELTENSPILKEFTREAIALPRSRSAVSWRKSLRIAQSGESEWAQKYIF